MNHKTKNDIYVLGDRYHCLCERLKDTSKFYHYFLPVLNIPKHLLVHGYRCKKKVQDRTCTCIKYIGLKETEIRKRFEIVHALKCMILYLF